MKRFSHALVLALIAGGCTEGGSGYADTTTRGEMTYKDAKTDRDGNATEPATPPPQPEGDPMTVEVDTRGTGEIGGLEPQCAADRLSGSFEGIYRGEASVGDDGTYLAAMSSSEAIFETPSGCDVADLQITSVSDVVVRAKMSATTENCESYCEAKARSYGEGECGAEASAAECRAGAESDYAASCRTRCAGSTTYAIVAETRLSAEAVAALSARSLTGAALGELDVDLVFDRMETDSGDPVEEAP